VSWAARYSEIQTLAPAVALKMAGKQPDIPGGFDLYVTAFFDLCTERPVSQGGVLSIPITKISWYTDWMDIHDSYTFIRIIQAMDRTFIKHTMDSLKKKENAAKSK
jgi:hypothetical protein